MRWRLNISQRSFGLVLLCIAICGCGGSTALENSVQALKAVDTIRRAEGEFLAKHGRYGNLTELGPSGARLISEEIAFGKIRGYDLQVEASQTKYTVMAWPKVFDKTGHRSLYCDQ